VLQCYLAAHPAEREISLISGQAVLSALQTGRVLMPKRLTLRSDQLAEIKQYDRAFIVLHGRGGEDGTMQGALRAMLNVPVYRQWCARFSIRDG
jgi:D-alanine-D-alanine ligase